MNAILSRPPVLWFLFLFNAAVAVAASFLVDGTQGLATSIGMGVVALGAGLGLLARSRAVKAARAGAAPETV